MKNKRKSSRKRIFFNASVILAGLKSPSGGSAKILSWCRSKRIEGLISEIVADEVIRNASRIGLDKDNVSLLLNELFSSFRGAPSLEMVNRFQKAVVDLGNAHILASSFETSADFLVTLDKRHLLILQHKIKWVRIVAPTELIEALES